MQLVGCRGCFRILFALIIWILGCFLESLGLKLVAVHMPFVLPDLGWGLRNLFYCLPAHMEARKLQKTLEKVCMLGSNKNQVISLSRFAV